MLLYSGTHAQKIESVQKTHEKYVKIGETLFSDSDEEFKMLVDVLIEDLKEKVNRNEFYKTKAFLNVLAKRELSSKYASLFNQYNVSYTTYLQHLKKGFVENVTEISPEEEKIYQNYLAEAEAFFEKQKTNQIINKDLRLDRDKNEILSRESFYKLKAYAKVAARYDFLDYIREDLLNLKSDYDYYLDRMISTGMLNASSNEKKLTKENYHFVKSPVYEGCDPNLPNQSLEYCTRSKIKAFFDKNFDMEQAQKIMNTETIQFFVHFDIDKQGNIKNIQGYTPNKKLDVLAKEALEKLPKLKPAKSEGKAVEYNYVMPFGFDTNAAKNQRLKMQERRAPIYPGCDEKMSNNLLRDCMNEKVSSFLNKSSLSEAAKKVLDEGMYKAYVKFKVTKEGYVEVFKINTDQPKLIPLVEEMIAGLPKMKPALLKGKSVAVFYTIPLNIKIGNSSSTKNFKAPIYPGCDMDMSNYELKHCMQEKIQYFFQKQIKKANFSEKIDTGNYNVLVNFQIDATGKVSDINADGLFTSLNNEVESILKKLPPIFPAKEEGLAVKSEHRISFSIEID
ncbi:hypothetical protein GCM10010832_17250 [Psychroflexus planctonicus]|uniref:TonB C-terminal domain-containing protein n=1 Tax=Psychroflexus planctonicus TaxID=1526575 RepID=A0ABQ1SFV8_9FLAO|nr:hypothetical protein GCM10010832_17250 [Psychroflexus planctonicus]